MNHAHNDGDHDHTHEHTHAPAVTHGNERQVLLAFAMTFTFMIVEAVGGVISGSLALLADAGHMLTDAAALALAWLAFRLGRRAADSRRTFGYLRFEVLAGFFNALTLFGIAIWIGIEAWQRLQAPHEVLAGPMLTVAVLGLVLNLVVMWILTRADTEHVNIQGAVLHVLGDLLGSVGAIAAAVIIAFTGWTAVDPILSVLVALLILRSAWRLLANSLHILLEGAPAGVSPDAIREHLRDVAPEVADVSHIHVWSITSGKILATLHATLAEGASPKSASRRIEHELKVRFGIQHATIAIDYDDDHATVCPLAQVA